MTHPDPVGTYEPFALHDGMLFLSAISSAHDGEMLCGKVGSEIGLEQAKEAARRAARNLLSVLGEAVNGDTSKIERILMVRGYVNAAEGYAFVHHVIDAASDLIIEQLGPKGRHARTSLGCAALPNGNSVTLEAIAIVRNQGDEAN